MEITPKANSDDEYLTWKARHLSPTLVPFVSSGTGRLRGDRGADPLRGLCETTTETGIEMNRQVTRSSHPLNSIPPVVGKRFLLTALLVVFAVEVGSSMHVNSPTVDEVTFVTTGYYILKTGDFSLNAGGNPILLQVLLGLPLLTMDLKLPSHSEPFFEPGRFDLLKNWRYAVEFFRVNQHQVENIILRSRLVVLSLSLLMAIYVFKWSKELYGEGAGIFSLFLYVFCPNVLAHSGLATLDVGAAAFGFVAVYYFSRLLANGQPIHLVLSGIMLGLALLSKPTAMFIVLALTLCLVVVAKTEISPWPFLSIRLHRRSARLVFFGLSLAGVLVIAWLLINLGYGFRGSFQPARHYSARLVVEPLQRNADSSPGDSANLAMSSTAKAKRLTKRFIGAVPVPFPSSLVEAAKFMIASTGHANAFLIGQYSATGWWYYHLVAFLIKVPVPTLLFLIASIGLALTALDGHHLSMEELIISITILTIFVSISVLGHAIGFRHVLPVLPLLFVFFGRLFRFVSNKGNLGLVAVALLCSWYVTSSLIVSPHYIAYFNELTGGPSNGYKYLVDSNLDWGQDLKGLKQYMDKNNIRTIKLSYFGSADPSLYGINYEYLPSLSKLWYEPGYPEVCGPTEGVVAVSVTNLQGVGLKNRDCFAWLRQYQPVAKIGYSIFVYRIKSQSDN